MRENSSQRTPVFACGFPKPLVPLTGLLLPKNAFVKPIDQSFTGNIGSPTFCLPPVLKLP